MSNNNDSMMLRERVGQALHTAIQSGAPDADWNDAREIDRLADAAIAALTTTQPQAVFALVAAKAIADNFVHGFFDDRMVLDTADIIDKAYKAASTTPRADEPVGDVNGPIPCRHSTIIDSRCACCGESQPPRQEEIVAWVSEHALRRVARNNGVIATTGFKEHMAHSKSDMYSVPLVRAVLPPAKEAK